MSRGWLVAILGLAACGSDDVKCGPITCPSDQVCDDAHMTCVFSDQLEVCSTRPDGDACSVHEFVDGFCDLAVCIESRCGDGILRRPEQCDGSAVAHDCRDLGYYDQGPLLCSP